ncbi:MAG: cyclic-di-AMP receptor [Firmicutes bacterium]|nr:cyclic-di-AMP receptor [Bacillota bacterium]
MKLVIAVVQDQDVHRLIERLLDGGFSATKLASTGGFLKEGNTTVLVGIEEEKVDQVVQLVRDSCQSRKQLVTPMAAVGTSLNSFIPRPIEVPVGGATIFVLDVDRFEKV